MVKDERGLPEDICRYIDKRIDNALRRQAKHRLGKEIARNEAADNISLLAKILFALGVICVVVAFFLLSILATHIFA